MDLINKNNPLSLVLDENVSANASQTEEERIIYKYKSASEIGGKILNSFMAFYDESHASFPLGDKGGKDKFGTICDIMSLSTMLEIKSLGVDLADYLDVYYGTIEKVFANAYTDEGFVCDAKPYWQDDSYKITTSVETASKLVSTLVDLRDDLLESELFRKNTGKQPDMKALSIRGRKVTSFRELRELTEAFIIDAVNMLNGAALPLDHPYTFLIDGKPSARKGVSTDVVCRGWAFQKPKENDANEYETSLYYTYYGTNAFISIYNSLEDLYDYKDTGEQPSFISADLLSEISDADKLRKYKFNADNEFFEKNAAALNTLREYTASSGRYIDTKLKENGVDIAFDYVDKELHRISIDTIGKGKNNYIMNSLFTFAILINAGIDDDYSSVGKSSIYQSIQFALTNIKKIYISYRDRRQEDLIDSFSLGEDKCPVEESVIMQAWRKAGSISTYDLVPLYCNTYNLISNYIIKYPQKEMRENLVWILENKADGEWFWTKESFSVNNNLYYIYALDSFYAYYSQYEQGFLDADNKKAQLNKKNREIKKLKDETEQALKKKDEEWEAKVKEAENSRSPLDKELLDFVDAVLQDKFEALLKSTLDKYFDKGLDLALKAAVGGAEYLQSVKDAINDDPLLHLLFNLSKMDSLGPVAKRLYGDGKLTSNDETGKTILSEAFKTALIETIASR